MAVTWKIRQGGEAVVRSREILRSLLLEQRGIDDSATEAFFEPRYERDIHDPLLLHGVEAAVERIASAAAGRQRVLVYGDYDADGITSTALLVTVLRQLGISVVPYLPHRLTDGYGLNASVLKRFSSEFDLLISVDCGISNADEISYMGTLGKDVIVIDHHTLPSELPPAFAVLHPGLGDYPFPYLCGAGTAWKLAQALLRTKRLAPNIDPDEEKWLLDLCCIGTVADMVQMTGENRAIVLFGCEVLRRTRRPGVRMLVAGALRGQQEVDATSISFRIAPLLNAAGRMDHAQPALNLLLAQRPERAEALARQLRRYNDARRTLSRRIQEEVEREVVEDDAMLVAYNDNWPAGVLGLVAGRLSDKFSRPAVVIGGGDAHAVGSVRAPKGFNAMAIMDTVGSHLLAFGGHRGAAGFSVGFDNVTALREALASYSFDTVDQVASRAELADALVGTTLLDWDTLEVLEGFAPYGEGNEHPRFIVQDLEVADCRPVGKTGEHIKLLFRSDGESYEGIGFGLRERFDKRGVVVGQGVDVLFHLGCNEYMGRRSLQLEVQDIAPTGTVDFVKNGI